MPMLSSPTTNATNA